MGTQILDDLLGMSIFVIIHSTICLSCSLLLSWPLWAHQERTSYIALLAWTTSFSSLNSLITQIKYMVLWKDITDAREEYAVKNLGNPEMILIGPKEGRDYVFYHALWCTWNAEALLYVAWASSLAVSVFQGGRVRTLRSWLIRGRGPFYVKGFALLFPVLQTSLLASDFLQRQHVGVYMLVAYFPMLMSLTIGITCLLAIFYKYIETKRQCQSWNVPYGQRPQNSVVATKITLGGVNPKTGQSIYDQWLVMRFTIAFVLLAFFQLLAIWNSVSNAKRNKVRPLKPGEVVFPLQEQIMWNYIFAISGVCPSLLCFIFFGTTKAFLDFFIERLIPRRIRHVFQMPEPPTVPACLSLPRTDTGTFIAHSELRRVDRDSDDDTERRVMAYTPTKDGQGIVLREMGPDGSPKEEDETKPIISIRPPSSGCDRGYY